MTQSHLDGIYISGHIFRFDSSDLPVPVPELLELADDDEEHLLGGDVEEQGHEVPVLQHY